VAKRLLTEQKKSQPRVIEKISKKYRLSKYRRKAENKKERERMKKFNQAFTNLKNLLPNKGLGEEDIPRTEKETKVSSLRSAITYINCLKELLEDCNAGTVGEEVYRNSSLLDDREKTNGYAVKSEKEKKPKRKGSVKKVSKRKWINYNSDSLEHKCCLFEPNMKTLDLKTIRDTQNVITFTSSPMDNHDLSSSPSDVNGKFLQINNLESASDTRLVTYVYTVIET